MPFYIEKIYNNLAAMLEKMQNEELNWQPYREERVTAVVKAHFDELFYKSYTDEMESIFHSRLPKFISELYPHHLQELINAACLKFLMPIRHLKSSLDDLRMCLKNRQRRVEKCGKQFQDCVKKLLRCLGSFNQVGERLLVVSYRIGFLFVLVDTMAMVFMILGGPSNGAAVQSRLYAEMKILKGILNGERMSGEAAALYTGNYYRVVPAMFIIAREPVAIDQYCNMFGQGFEYPPSDPSSVQPLPSPCPTLVSDTVEDSEWESFDEEAVAHDAALYEASMYAGANYFDEQQFLAHQFVPPVVDQVYCLSGYYGYPNPHEAPAYE